MTKEKKAAGKRLRDTHKTKGRGVKQEQVPAGPQMRAADNRSLDNCDTKHAVGQRNQNA